MTSEPSGDDAIAEPTRAPAQRATFRTPRTAIVAALFAMVCATPFAWSSWWLATVYLLPIGYIVWVVRTQTVVDAERIIARTVRHTAVVEWAELKGLAITARSAVSAVRTDGTEVRLPTVRTRHLPVLAAFSGGRVADPSKPVDDAAAQPKD